MAPVLCVLAVLLISGATALQPAEEAAILLGARDLWTNWDAALASPACAAGSPGGAWTEATAPCGGPQTWRGIACNPSGHVTGLNLSSCGLQGPLPPALASLQDLQTLDLSFNALTGGVPAEWRTVSAFGELRTLQLASNRLTGTLGDFTGPADFLAAEYFNVSRNGLSGGPIPPDWYSKTLALIDISYNNVSGPVPAQWGQPRESHEEEYPSALPSLARLALEGNNLTGPFDPWPGGGACVFDTAFLCTGKPGNPGFIKEKVPAPATGCPSGLVPAEEASGTSSGGGGGLSGGAIAGIVVGSVAGAAALGLAGWALLRRRRQAAAAALDKATFAAPGPMPPGSSVGFGKDLEKGKGGGGAGGDDASWHSGSLDSALQRDTDAAQLPADWNEVPFGELELSSCIGQGSFGSVWLARYCKTTVAVKILGGDKAPGATDVEHQRAVAKQLRNEASLMSKLRHTNVVLYMGACAEPPCLLMEYCARRSVDELLSQGRRDPRAARQLRWPRLLSMALDAAKGMLYLHTRSPAVVHRDLKSANLLVTSQYQVKVCDFNLSRTVENDFMSTVCLQNPRWLAPEVLAGGVGDLPADVYAFGTVLWELASWQAPFDGVNPYTIINTVQGAARGSGLDPPPAAQLPAGPLASYDAYRALMEACWERDPAARPGFEEVVERLRAILAAEMRRNSSSASMLPSPLANSIEASPQPSALPAGLAAGGSSAASAAAAGGRALEDSAGASRASFEAATRAASSAFQSALRGSPQGGSQGGDSPKLLSPFAAATSGVADRTSP